MGTPQEVRRASPLYLCSDEALVITGQAYPIDGGRAWFFLSEQKTKMKQYGPGPSISKDDPKNSPGLHRAPSSRMGREVEDGPSIDRHHANAHLDARSATIHVHGDDRQFRSRSAILRA